MSRLCSSTGETFSFSSYWLSELGCWQQMLRSLIEHERSHGVSAMVKIASPFT